MHSGFNPTLVRLRHKNRAHLLGEHISFNPTLVRLRRLKSLASTTLTQEFQSHAGSIEADLLHVSPWFLTQFQSHAGSIEALDSCAGA